LSTGTITYGPGATGWLEAPTLNTTTAPATLTVQPVTGALTPGAYTATIPVQSGVASNSPQTLTVTFTVTSSQSVVAFVGNNQTGLVGFALNVRPGVRLTGPGNSPVPNVSVTLAVASGGGSITNATVNTNANGVAQVGSWVLGGSAGPNTLTATVAGAGIAGNPVTSPPRAKHQRSTSACRTSGRHLPRRFRQPITLPFRSGRVSFFKTCPPLVSRLTQVTASSHGSRRLVQSMWTTS
jgi:hypothetical protein